MFDDRLDDALNDAARDYNEPPEPPRDAMWARIEAARRDAQDAQSVVGQASLPVRAGDREGQAGTPVPRGIEQGRLRWLAWPAGIAALLALGIGIGRGSVDTGPDARPAEVVIEPPAPSHAPIFGPAADDTADTADTAPERRRVPDDRFDRTPRGGATLARREAPDGGNEPAAPEATPRSSGDGAAGGMAYRVVTTQHLSQSEAFLTLFRASVQSGGTERLATATARQLLTNNRLLLDSPAAKDVRYRRLLEDLELVLVQIAQLQPTADAAADSLETDLIIENIDQDDVLFRIRSAVPAGGRPTFTQGVS